MALQQDPRKRAPRYTETYSKRNYQPSKKPLVLITAGIVACTVAVAAVAVSCQGGLDMGKTSTPGTVIGNPSSTNGGASANTDGKDSASADNKKDSSNTGDSGTNGSQAGTGKTNGGSNANSNGNAGGSSSTNTSGGTASNKYTPGQSIQLPSSTTTSSSNGSAFNKPTVTVSFSPDREKASLETFCKRLDDRATKLDDFCDDVFNEHLGSSYATLVKDYDKFEKLRKKVLDGIVDSDGDWVIYSYYGDKYLDAKVDMAKASKLLVERLDMIDEAYQAMFALGKSASSKEYVSAANKKLKNYSATTKKMNKLMEDAKAGIGL